MLHICATHLLHTRNTTGASLVPPRLPDLTENSPSSPQDMHACCLPHTKSFAQTRSYESSSNSSRVPVDVPVHIPLREIVLFGCFSSWTSRRTPAMACTMQAKIVLARCSKTLADLSNDQSVMRCMEDGSTLRRQTCPALSETSEKNSETSPSHSPTKVSAGFPVKRAQILLAAVHQEGSRKTSVGTQTTPQAEVESCCSRAGSKFKRHSHSAWFPLLRIHSDTHHWHEQARCRQSRFAAHLWILPDVR